MESRACQEKSDWAPGAEKRQLRRPLTRTRSLSRTAKEVQRLRAPTTECLDGEGDKAAPRKREGRVTGVFALGRPMCRKAVPIGCSGKIGGSLRVRDHHIPVNQRVLGRASEAVVEPRMLDLYLPPGVGPRTCPGRPIHLRGGKVSGLSPDGRQEVPNAVVAADDEAAHQAC